MDGISGPSDEQATIYPHKTDTCAACELLHSYLRNAKQALKCRLQQQDQGSLIRREATQEIRVSPKDLKDGLTQHKEEAAWALAYHKNCLSKLAA